MLTRHRAQAVWIWTRQQLAKVDIKDLHLQTATVALSSTVSNLGVAIDCHMNISEHIASLCRSCFYQLRHLRIIQQSVMFDAASTLLQAFISSCLDYCNGMLYGVADYQLCRFQAIQNAAARVVIGLRKFDHVSQALRDLHWPPFRKRVVFKIATLVFKCLHDQGPPYLTEYCIPVSSIAGRCHLRSANTQQLYIPRSRNVIGRRAFSVCGPSVWNSLPTELRNYEFSVPGFRRKLKTLVL